MNDTIWARPCPQQSWLKRGGYLVMIVLILAVVFVVRVPLGERARTAKSQPRFLEQAGEDEQRPAEVSAHSSAPSQRRPRQTDMTTTRSDKPPRGQNDPNDSLHAWLDQPVPSSSDADRTNRASTSETTLLNPPKTRPTSRFGELRERLKEALNNPNALRVHNSNESGGVVRFVADGKTYTLQPGQTVELSGQESWFVMFHRGGQYGSSRRTLKPGNYVFRVTERGWALTAPTWASEGEDEQ